jgi:hypothetical protein
MGHKNTLRSKMGRFLVFTMGIHKVRVKFLNTKFPLMLCGLLLLNLLYKDRGEQIPSACGLGN